MFSNLRIWKYWNSPKPVSFTKTMGTHVIFFATKELFKNDNGNMCFCDLQKLSKSEFRCRKPLIKPIENWCVHDRCKTLENHWEYFSFCMPIVQEIHFSTFPESLKTIGILRFWAIHRQTKSRNPYVYNVWAKLYWFDSFEKTILNKNVSARGPYFTRKRFIQIRLVFLRKCIKILCNLYVFSVFVICGMWMLNCALWNVYVIQVYGCKLWIVESE